MIRLLLTIAVGALATIAGAQTITTRTVDTGSGATTGQYIAHATISGCPAVTYSETMVNSTSSEGRIRRVFFARNSAADGSGTWVKSLVHNGPFTSTVSNTQESSLLEIEGKPAVFHHKMDGLWMAMNSSADGSGGWSYIRIASLADAGPLVAAIVDGKPAVVFRQNDTLKIARCTSSDGTAAWQVTQIDVSENTIHGSISLEMVDGKPAVAYRADSGPVFMGDYYDFTDSQLRYARCATVDGMGAWAVTTVHEAPYVDVDTYFQNSLAVMDGKPSIAFYYSGDLYHTRSSTMDGSGTWTTTAIETSGTTGSYPTLLTVAGYPSIAYYKSTGTDLRITRCDAVDGTGTWTPLGVETTGSVGSHARMIIADGNPAIAFFDATNFGIKWTRNSLPDASGSWTSNSVDDGSDSGIVGTNAHLVSIDGNPAVSYFDHLNGTFGRNKYARATTSSGLGSAWAVSAPSSLSASAQKVYPLGNRPAFTYYSAGTRNLENSAADGSGVWSSILIDSSGSQGLRGNLAMVSGYPMTVYASNTGNTLKIARNSSTDGSGTWSNFTLTGQQALSVPVLADVNGCPGIGYLDGSYSLAFTRNSAADGSGSWTTNTVSAGAPNLLAIFTQGGFPALVFTRYDSVGSLYHTVVSVNSAADGSGTWTETDFFSRNYQDYSNGAGTFAFIGGHPAIAYVSGSNRELRLRRSATPTFFGPWETWSIDASTMTHGPSMLDLGGGTAGIAYQNQSDTSLKYAHLDFSASATSALRIEKDGAMVIPGNIHVAFAGTTIHTTAPTQTLTLTNTGGTPLEITGINLTGTDAGQFPLTGSATTLAAGASTTVTIGYAPESATSGIHNATLTIASNDAAHPSIIVALSGTPNAMDTLEAWRFTHFGTVLDEGDAATYANPDNDGFDNYFEFATGTDPNSPNLYTPTLEVVGGNMEFTYTRSKEAVDYGMGFEVPWSEGLVDVDGFWMWNYDDTVQTVISETTTTQTVKAVVPMGTAGRRFLRLEPW